MTRKELRRITNNFCLLGRSIVAHMWEDESLNHLDCSGLMRSFVDVIEDTLDLYIQEDINEELRKQIKQ